MLLSLTHYFLKTYDFKILPCLLKVLSMTSQTRIKITNDFTNSKHFSSMASKPINIRWTRTGSQPYTESTKKTCILSTN